MTSQLDGRSKLTHVKEMRVFLHLHECGSITLDENGVEINGIEAARQAAFGQARAIMSAEVLKGRLCLSCCINVEDESGYLLINVPFRDALTLTGIRGMTPLAMS